MATASKMSRKYSLKTAIREARRIRRNLLRIRKWHEMDLAGSCGLASVLLSIALKDFGILRYADLSLGGGHVWTQVGDTIIDITASQFNSEKRDINVRGVLITKTPYSFHETPKHIGLDVYLLIINKPWYTTKDYSRWREVSEYWL